MYRNTFALYFVVLFEEEGAYLKTNKQPHIDLGWIQTLPLGIIHRELLPICWICRGSLILGACGDGPTGMLGHSEQEGYKWFFSPSSCFLGVHIGLNINNHPHPPFIKKKERAIDSGLTIRKCKSWPHCCS